MRYYYLAAASLYDNLLYSWCYKIDISTLVSLDRLIYILEFREFLVAIKTAFISFITLFIIIVYEGDENPKTVVALP